MGKNAKARRPERVAQAQMDGLLDRYSGCLDSDGAFREHLNDLRQEWPVSSTGESDLRPLWALVPSYTAATPSVRFGG